MKNKKLKRYSLANLIAGYSLMIMFIVMMLLNIQPGEVKKDIQISTSLDDQLVEVEEINGSVVLFNGHLMDDNIIPEREVVYVDREFVRNRDVIVEPSRIYTDHDRRPILDGSGNDIYVGRGADELFNDRDVYINDRDRTGTVEGSIGGGHRGRDHGGRDRVRGHDDDVVVDRGLLDRRIAELEDDLFIDESNNIVEDKEVAHGLDKDGVNLANFTVAREGDDIELGDIEDLEFDDSSNGKFGLNKGELYAYSFPSQGVGAGVGNSAVGAGSGAGAGLGAGIGQAVLNGETVPTLGGIGTYSSVPIVPPGTGSDGDGDGLEVDAELALGTDPTKADSDGDGYSDGAEVSAYTNPSNPNSNPGVPGSVASPTMGGVGGLVGGAGAGGAAGLITGMVKPQLGLPGVGTPGCTECEGECSGHGHGRHTDYDHLPKDGALHIMMHVDGSGSILNTRKQLDIMKDTLLKAALLPYYNNNEDLYNRRVTIVDGNGERTLQFFTDAAKKENVLAVVFQDEAQPAYHLPTFNKKPQDHYSRDLGKLKASLNGYSGVYRGVMFQVDRGKTFAKSFKEFVESAWRGEGYLESSNLKKYYRDNNNHHIKNKDGVVFSDEYHAKDSGDPQYYLNLIFNASKKVGLDLNIYGAGLKDGKYNK
jgi:hypothetical protein